MGLKWLVRSGLALVSVLMVILWASLAAGQTDINISGRNLFRLGGSITVPAAQVVDNAQAIGGSVTVGQGARVRQTAVAIGGNVVLQRGARVDGDAYAVGGQVITAPGATIGGATSGDNQPQADWQGGAMMAHSRPFRGYVFNALFHIVNVLIGIGIGLLLLRWRPAFMTNLTAVLNQYPGQSLIWGIGGGVAAILLILFLLISLLGIPLIPLVGLMVTLATLAGSLGVALWVGERLFATEGRSLTQQFVLGALILGAIGLIPVLGGLTLFVVYLFGLGALLAWSLGRVRPQLPT
uniref:DUF8173 domain-containing protein n=1 Tax=Cyanothece sp. (strain PCC 7425 / ATCC 29141) TaxID=395961 RepID=B8HTH1_CYAP4